MQYCTVLSTTVLCARFSQGDAARHDALSLICVVGKLLDKRAKITGLRREGREFDGTRESLSMSDVSAVTVDPQLLGTPYV